MCFFPCRCVGVTFCLWKGAQAPEKSLTPGTSFCHSTLGPSRAAGLVSQLQLPDALWLHEEFAGHRLASGPPTALTGVNFAWCRQSVGCFLPAATSLFLLLSLLHILSFSHFQLSQYFFITKKIPVCLWAARKGLLICTSFVVSDAKKIFPVMLKLCRRKKRISSMG